MITRFVVTLLLGWALAVIGLGAVDRAAPEGCDRAFRDGPRTLEFLEEWRPTCPELVRDVEPARTGRRG